MADPHQPSLYRTMTSGTTMTTMTTMTTSSASSSRTVRPDGTPVLNNSGTLESTDNMYMQNHRQQGHPPHYHPHRYPQNTSSFPPVPARSSSLHLPIPSPRNPPSLQVIHPTPSGTNQIRRESLGGTSVTSGETVESPESPMAPRQNTLDVSVETESSSSKPRRRDDLEDEEDEDEEEDMEEKSKRVLEERKARTREKGRERQRRKRERDRRAKDEAKATGFHNLPSTSLTTTSRLSIPQGSASQSQVLSMANMSLSTSSASSSYSPSLGLHSFNLSPNTSFASTSVSGQSSPGLLFSPAVSTTSQGHIEGGEWAMPIVTSTPNTSSKVKRNGKGRASTMSSTRPPAFKPQMVPTKLSGPSPAKRRKSEPQPEEFRQSKGKEVGLGVIIDDPSWTPDTGERPRPRRTASDGANLPSNQQSASRSPTPPVPDLPYAHRRIASFAPSEAGNFFSSTLLFALNSCNLGQTLQQSLNIGPDDLEEMKGELAGVYDRWRMEKSLRDVSLGSGSIAMSYVGSAQGDDQSVTSSTALSSAPLSSATESNPTSPIRQTVDVSNQSYFTPAPIRTAPPSQHDYPSTMPIFGTSHPSVLPAGNSGVDLPLAAQDSSMHSRARSLSSTSMLARGLVINPGMTQSIHGWPETPMGSSRAQQASEESTGSPSISIQTPSTAQGQGFPLGENMEPLNYLPPGPSTHWRSATDPMTGRRYNLEHQSMDVDMRVAVGDWQRDTAMLESPLGVQSQGVKSQYANHSSNSSMAPHPSQFVQPAPAPFSTPHHQRRAHRTAPNTLPFSPVTPVSMKGHHPQMNMGYSQQAMFSPMDPNQVANNIYQSPSHQSVEEAPAMLMYGYPPGVYGAPQQ